MVSVRTRRSLPTSSSAGGKKGEFVRLTEGGSLSWSKTFVLIGMLVLLSACFRSDYDVSHQLRPDFPLLPGTYHEVGRDQDAAVWSVTRDDSQYTAVSSLKFEDVPPSTHRLRFFRVPESTRYYVVQRFLKGDEKEEIEYFYALVGPDKVTFLGLPFSWLPPALAALTSRRKTTTGLSFADIEIVDGPRDTVYVLREVLRRGVELKVVSRFAKQN